MTQVMQIFPCLLVCSPWKYNRFLKKTIYKNIKSKGIYKNTKNLRTLLGQYIIILYQISSILLMAVAWSIWRGGGGEGAIIDRELAVRPWKYKAKPSIGLRARKRDVARTATVQPAESGHAIIYITCPVCLHHYSLQMNKNKTNNKKSVNFGLYFRSLGV